MIGLVRIVLAVFTLADRAFPSFPMKTSVTLPNGHFPRWMLSSTIRTRSAVAKQRRGLIHSTLSWRFGRYSFNQRLQNILAMFWTWRQRRLLYISSLLKTPGGKFGLALNNNRWFGVRESRSFGSLLTGVNGLPFKIPSTSFINVRSISSETSCCPSKALRILRTDLIVRSQAPPTCEVVGGLNFHVIFFWWTNLWIDSWFPSLNNSRSSLSPAWRFVPLSLETVVGHPRKLMNLRNAFMKESVSGEFTTSTWTAHTWLRHFPDALQLLGFRRRPIIDEVCACKLLSSGSLTWKLLGVKTWMNWFFAWL